MPNITRTLAILAALAVVAGCGTSPIKRTEGKTVYTQINLWVNGDEHLTTNYRAGWRLPVNSKVRILDTSGDAIDVRVADSGRTFAITNVAKYSGQNIQSIYDRYFAPSPHDLDGFGRSEAQAIRNGKVEEGMRKQAVIAARGYPPAHQTPSTDADQWKYWRTRFNTILVRFDNGRVSTIKN